MQKRLPKRKKQPVKKAVLFPKIGVTLREIEDHSPCWDSYSDFLERLKCVPVPGGPYSRYWAYVEKQNQIAYSPDQRIPMGVIINLEEGAFYCRWLMEREVGTSGKLGEMIRKQNDKKTREFEKKIAKIDDKLNDLDDKKATLQEKVDALEDERSDIEELMGEGSPVEDQICTILGKA